MQRLADNGLTYSQWHTTALCSPTRSCFLTGRNHHQNGFACISEGATGFPGSNGHIPMENASLARGDARERLEHLLARQEPQRPRRRVGHGRAASATGRSTGASTASTASSAARPTSGIPTSSRTTTSSTSRTRRRRATTSRRTSPTRRSRFIRDSKQSRPDKPWFMWFCPGANHAPHHAPQEWIDKYKGKFDDGYEAYREWVLPRMIEKRHPARRHRAHRRSTRCRTGRRSPVDVVRPWDSLSDDEKRLFSPHGRGLRRLLRVHRPPGRPHHRLPRGVRAARQHDRSSTAPTTARPARAARTARSTRTSSSTAGRTTSKRT